MENAIRQLGVFEGTWRTKGTGRQEPAITVDGIDTYRWFPGGHFMEHRVDVKMGGEHMQALEIISYDAEKQLFLLQSWNSAGQMTQMQGKTYHRSWTFFNDSLRGTFTFSENGGQLTGTWETTADGGKTWQPWLDMELTKTGSTV